MLQAIYVWLPSINKTNLHTFHKIQTFSDVTLCEMVNKLPIFQRIIVPLKCQNYWPSDKENLDLQKLHCENLKSHTTHSC